MSRQLLSKNGCKEEFYQDAKYFKLAGYAAYKDILAALDGLFGKERKGCEDIDWYKQHPAILDYKQLLQFVAAYNTLNLSMAHNPDAYVAQVGSKRAESIIDWIVQRTGHQS